jgi:hypothetical protein
MRLLTEAMNGLGAVLLQAVSLLALEELTFGGLVRLIMAPRPGAGKRGSRSAEVRRKGENTTHNEAKGEGTWSH